MIVQSTTKKILIALLMVGVLCAIMFFNTNKSQSPHTEKKLVVEKGMSVRQITIAAKDAGIVNSSMLLFSTLMLIHHPSKIYAGTYSFTQSQSVFDVARNLAQGNIDNELVTLTIPEGTSRNDIADIAQQLLEDFNTEEFLTETASKEGYLFPDTYHVPAQFSPTELQTLLTETFTKRTSSLKQRLETDTLSEYDVLIIASLLEREANSEESMRMVSGILQQRLRINMPLQVDASIGYVLHKPLSELKAEDLEIDSPYNTYKNKGLPPTPIGNPGMQAINAVLEPIDSEYLFYITTKDGIFHYAKTFEEHKRNIALYL